MNARRYPLDALLEATGLTESGLTRRAGISGTTLKNAREVGFTPDAADRYACRCGLTPLEVWHDWGLAECASDDCSVMFAPVMTQRFCSARCRTREKMRRYRQTAHGAEASLRARRRSREDERVREYERRQSQARYHADAERWREAERERRRRRKQAA